MCVSVCATKVWQCGGSVEVLPCSRIAHIERAHKPYTANLTALVRRNALRVADVWMDQYRSHVYMAWNVPLQVNITCVCVCACVCGSLILCSLSLCGSVCVGVIAYMLIYVQRLCHTSPSNREWIHRVGPLEDHSCISNVWTHLWRVAVLWVHVVLLMLWVSTTGLLHFKTMLLWHTKLLDLLRGCAGLPGPKDQNIPKNMHHCSSRVQCVWFLCQQKWNISLGIQL